MSRAPLSSTLALALGLTCVALAGDAHAQSTPDDEAKSLPCRPTIACTADIVKPGFFELETGMLFRRLAATKQWTFPFLAKLTLTRDLQLQVGSNGYTGQFDGVPARYFDDVTAGLKAHLFEQKGLVPSVALSAAIGLPVAGDQPGYRSQGDAFVIAYVTKDFGPLHVDLNLGVNDWGGVTNAVAQEWVALALSVPLPPPFGLMIENYYFTDAAPSSARDGGCLFALSLTPRPWLVFDFGGDVGYFSGSRAYSSFVGMTLVPVRLWH
jgi:hypothetical protein